MSHVRGRKLTYYTYDESLVFYVDIFLDKPATYLLATLRPDSQAEGWCDRKGYYCWETAIDQMRLPIGRGHSTLCRNVPFPLVHLICISSGSEGVVNCSFVQAPCAREPWSNQRHSVNLNIDPLAHDHHSHSHFHSHSSSTTIPSFTRLAYSINPALIHAASSPNNILTT